MCGGGGGAPAQQPVEQAPVGEMQSQLAALRSQYDQLMQQDGPDRAQNPGLVRAQIESLQNQIAAAQAAPTQTAPAGMGEVLGNAVAGRGVVTAQPETGPSLAEQMSQQSQLDSLQQQLSNPDNFIPGFTEQQTAAERALQEKQQNYITNLGGPEALNSPAVAQQLQDYVESQPEFTQLQELNASLQQNPEFQTVRSSAQEIQTQIEGPQRRIPFSDMGNVLADMEDRAAARRAAEQERNPAGFSETGMIGGREIGTPGPDDEVPGVLDLARGLITQPTDLPEQQLAGFTPTQLQAFQMAREGIGGYQPYLDQARTATSQGIFGTGRALDATRDLAGQVPGQIAGGQAALSQAAQDLQSFAAQGARSAQEAEQRILQAARSSDPATRLAADELMASSARLGQIAQGAQGRLDAAAQGALGVADAARAGGERVEARLEAQLAEANALAAEAAATGRADLAEAAERARASAAETADALYGAGEGARIVAESAAQNARALQAPLAEQMAQATGGARGIASIGQAGADIAADRARLSTAEAQSALQAASRFGQTAAEQGIAGLAGSSAMYDPSSARGFMSQYEDAAVQQALADIARQGELQERQLEAEAVQAGAFGGSRQAVAESELQRNILEQQGRTAAQMRAAGFESAAERSQQAFEQALARQQQASQLTGQLGQMGAGSAASAAQAAGQLGLSAEELAQSSALQGAQLGLSGEQLASANAQAVAQTGLNIEQLAAQTGLSAQELAGNFAAQAGQLNLSTEQMAADAASRAADLGMNQAQFQAANAQALAQTGMNVEQLAAQTGLSAQELAGNFAAQGAQIGMSAEQQRQAAASRQAELAQSQAQIGMQGAQSAGQMGMSGAQMQMQGAQAAGDLGLQGANLGLAGIQAGLGAQQQAAGLSQGIAGLGQQFLGQGQAQQQMGLQDINTMLGIGGQQQRQIQAGYDTAYQNQYAQAMQPYQQLAYYSDIVTGAPSGQASTMSQPGPSIGSQVIGGALAIPAIYQGFQGMTS